MGYSYNQWNYSYTKALAPFNATCYDDVQVAVHTTRNPRGRILFLADDVQGDCLRTRKILAGAFGELFFTLISLAEKQAGVRLDEYDWAFALHGSINTRNASQAMLDVTRRETEIRTKTFIDRYKPTIVVTFGNKSMSAVNEAYLARFLDKRNRVAYHHHYGTAIPTTLGSNTFVHCPCLDINALLMNDYSASLIGYAGRNLVTALLGKLKYSIPKQPKFKIVMVDTLDAFDRMMEVITYAKEVAVDTEANNLNRRANETVTWQFATDSETAYILPFKHKDTPFLSEELAYIKDKLRQFFEYRNKNKYHLYANATYDMVAVRRELGVRRFKNDIWDVFAGEFALDENMRSLMLFGGFYYSLANLTVQYGCTAYFDTDFGKQQRAFIKDMALEGSVLYYMGMDVVALIYLKEQQIKRAKDIGYDRYEIVAGKQIADTLHAQSGFEFHGSRIDLDYLFKLKSPESSIIQQYNAALKKFNECAGVITASKILSASLGAPTTDIFGRKVDVTEMFNIGKSAHKDLLFFEVLGLKPLRFGMDGKGAIDKEFQKVYKDVPEVAAYTELGAISKIFNAYVKSFIRKWGEDDDFRFDQRIRPSFGYLLVVTGRTSARDPTLQTLPSRSEIGKLIKRCFIAVDGYIIVKIDYSVLEVRAWAIIAQDKALMDVFNIGVELRKKFRLHPSDELAKDLDLRGDVHRVNAAYFFKMNIMDLTSALRNRIKTIVFGLIYQQSAKGSAKSLGVTVEEILELSSKFFAKFPVGTGWFEKVKSFARKHLYVESPIGRRRNLWGLLFPKKHNDHSNIYARNERQSVNSPCQGFGSDCAMTGTRCIEDLKWEHYVKTKHYPDFFSTNSVHDSLEFMVNPADFWLAINLIQQGMTVAVAQRIKERTGFEMGLDLEIDFEIGANLKDCEAWNYALTGDYPTKEKYALDYLLDQTVDGLNELGMKVDKKAFFKTVDSSFQHAPEWAKQQRKNMAQAKREAISA